MATFKSDDQGFLIGEKLVDSTVDVLRMHERAMPVWRAIRSDVRSIARQLGVQTASVRRSASIPVRTSSPVSGAPAAASGAAMRAGARAPGARPQAVVAGRSSSASAQRASAAVATRARDSSGRFVAAAQSAGSAAADQRDARGRFTARGGDGSAGGAPGVPGSLGGAAAVTALTKAGEGITRVASAMTGADNLDPTINAMREVKDVVSPLGRGIGGLFGRNAERKKEAWYRRLFKAIKDNKPPAAVAGGQGGGGLLRMLSPGMLGAGLSTALRGAGGLLRKLPVIGGLFAGGMSLAGALGLNDDPSKTPEENRAMRYRSSGQAGGMGAGALVGGALGSLLGPLGTVGGAWLGSIVGEKIGAAAGDWVKSMVDAKVPERIVEAVASAWQSVTASVKSGFEKAKAGAAGLVSSASSAATKANDAVKARTGIDIAGGIKSAREGVNAAGAAAGSFVRDNAGKLVPETVKRAAAAGGGAVRSMLGINKVVETGAGYNVVEREDGSVVKQQGARNWRNNNPGNIEFGEFAKRYGATGSDGRFAIFPTYEAGRRAKEALIFEGKGYRGLSLTDAISRYAPPSENNTKAYQSAVLGAVGGRNKPMSEYTAAERTAIMDAMQRVEGFKVGTVTTMRPAAPPMPSLPAAGVQTMSVADIPKPVEPKEPPRQLNADEQRPQTVKLELSEGVGQDVRDRSLAHIVSGGLGS